MSQHTPGTWASRRHATAAAFPQFGIYSENGNGHDLACVMSYGTSDPTETEANARLMAAAPDLLAALEGLTAIVAEYRERVIKGEITGRLIEHDYAELAAARAAIRKATEDSTHA